MTETIHKGSCICGAVKVAAAGDPIRVVLCHCSHCKLNASGPSQVGARFPEEKCTIDDAENVLRSWKFTDTQSGNPKLKFFCSRCGVHLFSEAQVDGKKLYSMRPAHFEGGLEALKPFAEGFVEQRASFLQPALLDTERHCKE